MTAFVTAFVTCFVVALCFGCGLYAYFTEMCKPPKPSPFRIEHPENTPTDSSQETEEEKS